MKRLGVVLFVAVIGVSACKTASSPDGGSTFTPVLTGVVHCAEEATHKAALGLLDDVAAVLAGGNWEVGLADLAGRFGEAAVACAVQEIAGTANHNAMASSDPTELAKAQHGRQWLAKQKFQVTQ